METRNRLLQGRYELIAPLSEGGMGSTYRAYDHSLDNECVIKELKFLSTKPREMEALVAQFRQEAQILSRLRHPGLPRVFDYFSLDGKHYLVMDVASGRSLDTMIGNGMSEDEALKYADQVLDILGYIHSQNVIHRDVKPSNIIVSSNGHVVLVDFGLTKNSNTSTAELFRGFGTEAFAPPEQYRGGTDPRSDIYAFGATLYFLLTGLPPPSAVERMAGVELVSPSSLKPEISTITSSAIVRALQLQIGKRFETTDEFRQQLIRKDESSRTKRHNRSSKLQQRKRLKRLRCQLIEIPIVTNLETVYQKLFDHHRRPDIDRLYERLTRNDSPDVIVVTSLPGMGLTTVATNAITAAGYDINQIILLQPSITQLGRYVHTELKTYKRSILPSISIGRKSPSVLSAIEKFRFGGGVIKGIELPLLEIHTRPLLGSSTFDSTAAPAVSAAEIEAKIKTVRQRNGKALIFVDRVTDADQLEPLAKLILEDRAIKTVIGWNSLSHQKWHRDGLLDSDLQRSNLKQTIKTAPCVPLLRRRGFVDNLLKELIGPAEFTRLMSTECFAVFKDFLYLRSVDIPRDVRELLERDFLVQHQDKMILPNTMLSLANEINLQWEELLYQSVVLQSIQNSPDRVQLIDNSFSVREAIVWASTHACICIIANRNSGKQFCRNTIEKWLVAFGLAGMDSKVIASLAQEVMQSFVNVSSSWIEAKISDDCLQFHRLSA